jgi:hypothetical protein
MAPLRIFASLFAFAALTVPAVGVAGCSNSAPDASTSSDDLTSIKKTTAKQQSIANCWLYAVASWNESLHLRVSTENLDISEAYWSYFHWFDRLTDNKITQGNPDDFAPTGLWGTGLELMRQRGWMNETDFLPQDGGEVYSARQQRALETLDDSLYSGALSSAAARADRALVISELTRAWGLLPEVAEQLRAAFGPTYERTLLSPEVNLQGGGVHAPREISVGRVTNGATTVALTMEDILGEPAPDTRYDEAVRVGKYAWSQVWPSMEFNYGDGRPFIVRVQKALNQNLPVGITWWADDKKLSESGAYSRIGKGYVSRETYLHTSLIVDYQVNAPGFGVLPVGVPETRPEALAASLLPDAEVQFFRIKNPWWGSYDLDGQRTAFADGPGYHDVDLDYLHLEPREGGMTLLHAVMLPNDESLVIDAK